MEDEITIPLSVYRALKRDSVELAKVRANGAPDRLLTVKEVCAYLSVGRTTLYQLRTQDGFPRSVGSERIGLRWFANDVEAWMRSTG